MGAGTTNKEGHKDAVADPELAPAGIILDAELTLDTPERLWQVSSVRFVRIFIPLLRLSSGMRALDHAVGKLASIAC